MFNFKKLMMFTVVLVIVLGFGTVAAYADEAKNGTVSASTLNLRKSASTSSSVVTTLEKGAKLTILKTSNGWYSVKTVSGKTGWVLSKYVSAKAAATAVQSTASKSGIVSSTTLNLRKGASTSSSVVDTLKQGQALTILKTANGWYNVKTSSGKTGWVSSKYVTVKSETTNRGGVTRTPIPAEQPKEQTQEQPKEEPNTQSAEQPTDATVDQTKAASEEAADLGSEIVSYAKNFLGVKYVYGGMSPTGFDCSGFVKYVYDHFNINIARVSTEQATQGVAVSRADLKPGDLVFFDTNGGHNRVNHAGIYIGNGSFIQASSGSSTGKVVISTLNSGFYNEAFMTARRFF